MRKVLIIDPVHPLIPEALSALGFTCEEHFSLTPGSCKAILGEYEGVIIRSGIRLTRDILEKGVNLRFIGRVGSGLENIDTAFAASMGIACLNSPEGNRDAVGEHATGMLLALLNHMVRANREVREGKWIREGNRGTEIRGKTIGIVGYGNMGSSFARKIKGFDARVLSYDKYKKDYSDGNTLESTMDELFEQADIVSLHVPLTDETRYLANDAFFGRFRKNIWLINTSRGPVVETASLVRNLRSGKVSGAALDVLEYEESSFEEMKGLSSPDFRYLAEAENVLLTPHIAGWTHESNIKLATVLVEKIKSIL
jgi:D-3-phosphoglycerate dehydrogenase / 2-oxoglutarate reductase